MSVDMPFTDEALQKTTGKNWQEWIACLEEWGAKERSYLEISRYLSDEFGLNDWWSQGITVGYERKTVRRSVGKLSAGVFSAGIDTTINASIELTHSTIVDGLLRHQWLDGSVVRLRTSLAPKFARFDDYEAKVIIVFTLTKEGDENCQVQLQADTFTSTEAGEEWKAAWEPRLAQLAQYLEQKRAS